MMRPFRCVVGVCGRAMAAVGPLLLAIAAAVAAAQAKAEEAPDAAALLEEFANLRPLPDPAVARQAAAALERARSLADEGKLEAALEAVDESIRLNSQAPQANLLRAKLRFDTGDNRGAMIDCALAIDLDPKFADAYALRALIWTWYGELEYGKEDLDEAIKLRADVPLYNHHRGQIHWLNGDRAAALQDFMRALELDDAFTAARIDRIRLYVEMKKLDEAKRDAEWLIQHEPKNHLGYHHRGVIHFHRNELELGLIDLNQAIRLNTLSAESFFERGKFWSRVRETDRAIADLSHAINLNAQYADAYFERAECWARKQEFAKGLLDASEILILQPGYPGARLLRARLWSQVGEWHRAETDVSIAIVLEPDNPILLNLRGVILQQLHEHELAAADFGRAAELAPQEAMPLFHRAISLTALRKFEEAEQDFAKAKQLGKEDAAFYVARGSMHRDNDRPEEALADYNRALELDPTFHVTYLGRGMLHRRLEQHDDAVQDFAKVLRREPNNIVAIFERAHSYRSLGEYEKALADFESALRLGPHFPRSHSAYAWTLATCPEDRLRNGKRAVELAEKAMELVGDPATLWEFLDALAAAHAEAGNFKKAVEAAEEAQKLAPESDRQAIGERLELFRAGKPYRERIGNGTE